MLKMSIYWGLTTIPGFPGFNYHILLVFPLMYGFTGVELVIHPGITDITKVFEVWVQWDRNMDIVCLGFFYFGSSLRSIKRRSGRIFQTDDFFIHY